MTDSGDTGVVLRKITDNIWEIPKTGAMRVPGRIYASEDLMKHIRLDKSVEQVSNVAQLPGIQRYSLAMPDIHWGYGFPIGGVAAMDPDEDGVISPGGIGYDINCGVRLTSTLVAYEDVRHRVKDLVSALYHTIPTGVGARGAIPKLSRDDEKRIMERGAGWAIEQGYGSEEDLAVTEEQGRMEDADPAAVSEKAIERGLSQVGTLGSGNHFIEIDVVDHLFDPAAAAAMGLREGCLALMIHCGSRGFGYQICDDYLEKMGHAVANYGIAIPDRQLACAPIRSAEGQDYLAAMRCAANYAWCNRQVIMHLATGCLSKVLGRSPGEAGLGLVYDVAHNIAKFEEYDVGGKIRRLCVHRKGATRAFPAGHPETPAAYRSIGQPVLVPGDMGRCSYVCVGAEQAARETFGSSAHGAGRMMSRSEAKRRGKGRAINRELEDQGVIVMTISRSTLSEEMPDAYKDVEEVVDVMDSAGIMKRVARLRPIGVVKG